MQYQIQWQAGRTVQQAVAMAPPEITDASLVQCLRLRQQRARADVAAAIYTTAQLLQRLQQQGTQQQHTQLLTCAEVHDSVAGSRSTTTAATAAAAAAAALLRVAASEAPDLGFSVVQTSPQLAGGSAAASDAHGVALSAGAVLLPLLLPAFQTASRTGGAAAAASGTAVSGLHPESQPASWRQVAISGGLGGLGGLAAAWLACQGAQHIVLLGRTGR